MHEPARIARLAALLVAAVFALTGSPAHAETTPDGRTKIVMPMPYPPGAYEMRVEGESEQRQTSAPVVTVTRTRWLLVFDMDVGAADATGSRAVRLRVMRVTWDTSTTVGEEVVRGTFDSALPPAEQDRRLAAALAPLVGAAITLRFDRLGFATSVRGIDEVLNAALQRSPGFESTVGDVKREIGNAPLADLLTVAGVLMPRRATAPGDRWQAKGLQPTPGHGRAEQELTCRLDRVEAGPRGKVVVVAGEMATRLKEPVARPFKHGQLTIQTMAGRRSASMRFNLDSAIPERVDTTWTLDTTSSVLPDGKTAPIRLSQENKWIGHVTVRRADSGADRTASPKKASATGGGAVDAPAGAAVVLRCPAVLHRRHRHDGDQGVKAPGLGRRRRAA